MKKLLFFLIFTCTQALQAQIPFSCIAESAVVMNSKTGKIIFTKNASKRLYPASLTKIATCIVAIEKGSSLLDKKVRASENALRCLSAPERQKKDYMKYPPYTLEHGMTHTGLKVDEESDFRDLLYALMMISAGDAANVIAENVSGSVDQFMNDVNALLARLHCTESFFYNPSGLHYPNHMTTAMDIATLSRYSMQNPLFREIVKTVRYEKKATNKQPAAALGQVNNLLKRGANYYPYAIGIKTGYHMRAQHNLAACAEKDGRELILVLMHCRERQAMFQDAKRIFEKLFAEEKKEKVVSWAGMQAFSKTFAAGNVPLTTFTKDKLVASFYPSEEPELSCTLEWDPVSLPIRQGQKVGVLKLYGDKMFLSEAPLYAKEEVSWSFFAFVHSSIGPLTVTKAFLMLAVIVAVALFCILKKKKGER